MKKSLILCMFIVLSAVAFGQKGGPVVFTVDADTVWGAEFERVFNKNNKTPDQKPSMQEIEEYLDLYVRFKLKVKEAYALNMHENEEFKRELAGYRKQLAQPYLTDKSVTENLINEAYERMKFEVDASNLMIHLPLTASPADSLAAWKRINKWYDLISSGKYSFEQMATDSSTDEHGREHEGKLGYFTAFSMIYPFENEAYNTKVGKISKPFRTQFGYHILKVNDKRPARGDLKVAHILIRINNEADYEKNKPRIDAIYERLQKGKNWESLVLDFSEDFSNREKGGELNWIKSIGGTIPAEFREVAYGLKNGEYSKPIKTEIGWHIVKRLEDRQLAKLQQMKESIKFKISRDSRSALNKEAVLTRIKKENNFFENETTYALFMSTLTDDNLAKWKPNEFQSSDAMLFTVGDTSFTVNDFSDFIIKNQVGNKGISAKRAIRELYLEYTNTANLSYEESILEEKYDDFKYLMQEYRDGILLFDLSNKMVWSKASEDTLGLKAFYKMNADDYTWDERAKLKTYTCSNKKTAKKAKKMLGKGVSDADLLAKLNKKNALAIKIDEKLIERGQSEDIDQLDWTNLNEVQTLKDASSNKVYAVISEVLPPTQKEMKEAMGPITSDYQQFLEDAWIKNLKAKYTVKVNQDSLSKLFIK